MDPKESAQVPSVDDFAPEYLVKFLEEVILDIRTRTSWRRDVEYFQVGFKGMHPNKS